MIDPAKFHHPTVVSITEDTLVRARINEAMRKQFGSDENHIEVRTAEEAEKELSALAEMTKPNKNVIVFTESRDGPLLNEPEGRAGSVLREVAKTLSGLSGDLSFGLAAFLEPLNQRLATENDRVGSLNINKPGISEDGTYQSGEEAIALIHKASINEKSPRLMIPAVIKHFDNLLRVPVEAPAG